MSDISFNHKEQEKYNYDTLLEEVREYQLVLFNDDVNTFDWVIESLMDVCDHDEIQAEQSAYIVHYKGKCTVKSGKWEEMELMHNSLANRDLSVEIQ